MASARLELPGGLTVHPSVCLSSFPGLTECVVGLGSRWRLTIWSHHLSH